MAGDSEQHSLNDALRRLSKEATDPEAWEVLFRQTWPYVLGSARHHLGSLATPQLVEDVAQDVFLRLSRALHQQRLRVPENGKKLYSLMAVLTRNRALDLVRQEHRQRRDVSRTVALDALRPQQSSEPPPVLAAAAAELLKELAARLGTFDQGVLDLLLLGQSPERIAQQLGTSKRTIYRHQRRIRALCREVLEKQGTTVAAPSDEP